MKLAQEAAALRRRESELYDLYLKKQVQMKELLVERNNRILIYSRVASLGIVLVAFTGIVAIAREEDSKNRVLLLAAVVIFVALISK